ncbi:hypothetical protein ACHAXR_008107 [Thalassiosira sp. AJA248-18]
MIAARPTNEPNEGTLHPPKSVRPLCPKPKRPLSAFNLFYRFKRQQVLDAVSDNADKDSICRLVDAAPGLEHTPAATEGVPPEALYDLRRKNIRKELENNLMPRDTRQRAHRTNQSAMNGTMSFLELGKVMNASWKNCDDFAKSVFKELAEEGREMYRQRLNEWEAMTKSAKKQGGSGKGPSPVPSLKETFEMFGPDPENAKVTRTAESNIGRTISTDFGTSQEIQPPQGQGRPTSSEANNLIARVKELEGQLAVERLQARVRELENEVVRQRTVEGQLRAQIEVLTRNRRSPTVAKPSGGVQDSGLWSLVNASMIHPSVHASGRAGMISRIAATRNPPTRHHAMPHQPIEALSAQGPEQRATIRQRDPPLNDSPNKKQRCN